MHPASVSELLDDSSSAQLKVVEKTVELVNGGFAVRSSDAGVHQMGRSGAGTVLHGGWEEWHRAWADKVRSISEGRNMRSLKGRGLTVAEGGGRGATGRCARPAQTSASRQSNCYGCLRRLQCGLLWHGGLQARCMCVDALLWRKSLLRTGGPGLQTHGGDRRQQGAIHTTAPTQLSTQPRPGIHRRPDAKNWGLQQHSHPGTLAIATRAHSARRCPQRPGGACWPGTPWWRRPRRGRCTAGRGGGRGVFTREMNQVNAERVGTLHEMGCRQACQSSKHACAKAGCEILGNP